MTASNTVFPPIPDALHVDPTEHFEPDIRPNQAWEEEAIRSAVHMAFDVMSRDKEFLVGFVKQATGIGGSLKGLQEARDFTVELMDKAILRLRIAMANAASEERPN